MGCRVGSVPTGRGWVGRRAGWAASPRRPFLRSPLGQCTPHLEHEVSRVARQHRAQGQPGLRLSAAASTPSAARGILSAHWAPGESPLLPRRPGLPRLGSCEQSPGAGRGPGVGSQRELRNAGRGLLRRRSCAPSPSPLAPHRWAWRVRAGLVRSPPGLETDWLCLWRNESGFPLLTSLLIRS